MCPANTFLDQIAHLWLLSLPVLYWSSVESTFWIIFLFPLKLMVLKNNFSDDIILQYHYYLQIKFRDRLMVSSGCTYPLGWMRRRMPKLDQLGKTIGILRWQSVIIACSYRWSCEDHICKARFQHWRPHGYWKDKTMTKKLELSVTYLKWYCFPQHLHVIHPNHCKLPIHFLQRSLKINFTWLR